MSLYTAPGEWHIPCPNCDRPAPYRPKSSATYQCINPSCPLYGEILGQDKFQSEVNKRIERFRGIPMSLWDELNWTGT